MSVSSYVRPHGDLLFHWEPPRRRHLAIAGFVAASALFHGLCFYMFQVVYPPTVALLPPPARLSVITPTSPAARSFLNWIQSEDPALAWQTQRPADARAFQLPKLAHVPSYVAETPKLQPFPAEPAASPAISALPPAPVPVALPAPPQPIGRIPTVVHFSGPLGNLPVTLPELHLQATQRQTPQDAVFRLAIDSLGAARLVFLEQSSNDPALDEAARDALVLARFGGIRGSSGSESLRWGTATVEFGNDVQPPPGPEHTP